MEYNIDEIVSELDFNSLQFANLKTGLLLTNNEIRVLDKYNIDYNNCGSLKEVLSLIDEVLNNEEVMDFDELDNVSLSIAERDYYQNTNK